MVTYEQLCPGPPTFLQRPWPPASLTSASWNACLGHRVRRKSPCPKSPTFTAIGGDLRKRVVTAITLTPNDTRLARTLAILRVTDSGQRAGRVTVTQEAGGAARWPVVIVLGEKGGHQTKTSFLGASGSFELWPPWRVSPYPGSMLSTAGNGSELNLSVRS